MSKHPTKVIAEMMTQEFLKGTSENDIYEKIYNIIHPEEWPRKGAQVARWRVDREPESCPGHFFDYIEVDKEGWFRVWHEEDSRDPQHSDWDGNVKWDGCANFGSNPRHCIHTCGPGDVETQMRTLQAVYACAHDYAEVPSGQRYADFYGEGCSEFQRPDVPGLERLK